MLGIIGGSGLSKLGRLDSSRRKVVRTPYGEASGAITHGRLSGIDVIFIARHGYGHTIPPHAVNYRANLWALSAEGATKIVSVASVGGIRADLGPGALAVPHQIIDYTHGRQATYFDGADGVVRHVDFTRPYTDAVRELLLRACQDAGESVVDGGVYAATQGPRLETAAEIERLARDGADMVGMTGMPEAVLARELDMPYAALAVVANWAAGRGDSRDEVALSAIEVVLEHAMERVHTVLEHLVELDGHSTRT